MTLQEDAARKVFQQMLDALDYCHKLGIYHRQAMFTSPVRQFHAALPQVRCPGLTSCEVYSEAQMCATTTVLTGIWLCSDVWVVHAEI